MTIMIVIRLREAVERYKRLTDEEMNYAILADRTGLSEGTLRNIGARAPYNATLETIEKICRALEVSPGFLLHMKDEHRERKRKSKKKKRKSKV